MHTLQRECINVILLLVARVSVSFSSLSNRKPTAAPVNVYTDVNLPMNDITRISISDK